MNKLARAYLDGTGLPLINEGTIRDAYHEKLLGDIQEVEQEMDRRSRMTYTAEENNSYVANKMYEIQSEYWRARQAQLDGLKKSADRIRKEYLAEKEKYPEREALEIKKAELRYAAMTNEAIEKEAQNYITNPSEEWSPNRLAVLNADLIKRGIKKVSWAKTVEDEDGNVKSEAVETRPFGEWIEKHRGAEPWRHMKPELFKAVDIIESEGFGTFTVVDNEGEVENFKIIDAYKGKK